MSAQHIFGLWRVCDDTDVVDARGRYVATTHDATSDVGTQREYDAAKFIVRACNSHYALLAALELMTRAYESVLPGIKYIAVQDYALLNDAPIAAAAAIKLARGEQ